MAEKLIKSKQRVKKYGEVFTPEHIVKEMCDLVEPDLSDVTKKVLEPACGDGNFLAQILTRRLKKAKTELEFLQAISNIYGVELLQDNRNATIFRLFEIIAKNKKFKEYRTKYAIDISHILLNNILQGNYLKDELEFKVWDYEWHEFEKIEPRYIPKITVKKHKPIKR